MQAETLVNKKEKVDVVKVFADKRLSLSELTRIASQKIRSRLQIESYINILDAYYFEVQRLYVVLFEVPSVFLNATSESSMETES
jgi:hypothetical protein